MFSMQFEIHLFFAQFIFLCNLFIFTSTKPLVGENVRIAGVGEYPFVVALGLSNPNVANSFRQYCTGSLVSNRDVLTSEHCVMHKDYNRILVHIGSRDLRSGVKHTILYWLSFIQWAKHATARVVYEVNDIAMIRLRLNVSATIRPGFVSTLRNEDFFNKEVSLAGWGRKNDGRKPVLMETVDVNVVSPRDCEDRFKTLGRRIMFEASTFCSSAVPPAFVHDGDSGGPVIFRDTIVGVTKGTCPLPTLNESYQVNVHIGTFSYRHFIMGFIENLPNII